MPAKRHPNKEIAAAVGYAISRGWRLRAPGKSAHAWGHLLCPANVQGGCRLSVWSTPKNPETHAKQIRRTVDRCQHEA